MKKFLFLLIAPILILNVNLRASQSKNYQFKAIIFDMDGTILNTEVVWDEANHHILTTYAPHLDEKETQELLHTLKNLPLQDGRKLMQATCSVAISIDQIIEEKTNYVLDVYANKGISFIPFFIEFHAAISELGIKTAVATNATQHSVNCIVQQVPLKNYFATHIYTIDHVNQIYKPQPDVYLHAAAMIGIDPQDCIAIEDTLNGIKAAKAAGMYCIGINTGKNRKNLELADEIVECFSEIDIKKLFNIENRP
ncbi:HAD family phosphatase [Candidatus Babeliales bacterium]|nr:HAD family phosphatase [Candidatus Babeliales bacterium]MBP9844212.1 HAD family phosphatase [Candidatus Babeliales bacterium]